MKSSLKKLRGFALHKHDDKGGRGHPYLAAQFDEFEQASRDLQDMKCCYDRLLSASAAMANNVFEFSQSLREMGDCLLEKTALNDDEDSGRVLLMLGKVQLILQKIFDGYRSHISQTITTPSECLLDELQIVEEMKQSCDEKRRIYQEMVSANGEKGRSKGATKEERFSPHQLQTAYEDYDNEATLFMFRLKSLRQGQSRSLLTQASRHYAAQLSFLRKGLKSLEALEPHVKLVTEQQHIDYKFSGLDDDDVTYVDDVDVSDSDDNGELSFDYGPNPQAQDTVRNSMEDRSEGDSHASNPKLGFSSHSAPIYLNKRLDLTKVKEARPSFSREFHSYALPTPPDITSTSSVSNSAFAPRCTNISGVKQNVWFSTPLAVEKRRNLSPIKTNNMKSQSILKESDLGDIPKVPPPPTGVLLSSFESYTSDTKKIKRKTFSGPLATKNTYPTTLPTLSKHSHVVSQIPLQTPSCSVLKVSPSASPPPLHSPRKSELHKLPSPPIVQTSKAARSSPFVGHSAPLIPRNQGLSCSNKMSFQGSSQAAGSPLPMPPGIIPRSFSIPSRNEKTASYHSTKLEHNEDVASPPLTPISLTNIQPLPTSTLKS